MDAKFNQVENSKDVLKPKQEVIKVKLVHDNAKLPEKAHESDAAFDLYAADCFFDSKFDCWVYDTGIAVEMPRNVHGFVYSRSSVANVDAILTNCVGIIDNGYRGTIKLKFKNIHGGRQPFDVGNRIGQIIFKKLDNYNLVEVDELNDTERGEGGYGSTGE